MQVNDGFGNKEIVRRTIVSLDETTPIVKKEAPLNELQDSLKVRGVNCKAVSSLDTEAALGLNPNKAVDFLLEKSPLGKVAPKNIESLGYTESGALCYCPERHFSGPGGRVDLNTIIDEDGTYTIKYKNKNDKFEQIMHYDKNGNMKGGTIILKDDYGYTMQKYMFTQEKNGNMSISVTD